MQAGVVSLLLVSASLAQYGPPQRYYGHNQIRKDELEQQKQAFKQWWEDDLTVKLSDLPAEGKVPEFRVPYSGHDYPDRGGGTVAALTKYDRAFHSGQTRATQYEWMDVSAHRNTRLPGRNFGPSGIDGGARGLFGRLRSRSAGNSVPTWYGHCNGWTAAAIRHAEPQTSVVRNGVTFTPSDIKGLLAEMYMYCDSEFLGGIDPAIHPGVLHLVLGNWLGRGAHPVGMETAVGEVVINFPVFGYKSVVKAINARESDVKTWITYTLNTNREMDKGPANYHRQMYFHYVLDTDEEGAIRGGRYFGDSQQIDMLWTPLKPAQGGEERNKRGNPHMNVKDVLAIWRDSVPEDLRKKWLNIDPTEEDRVLPATETIAATDNKPAVADKPAAAADKPAEAASAATTGAGATETPAAETAGSNAATVTGAAASATSADTGTSSTPAATGNATETP
jgi:hypothetical protein